MHGLIHKIAQTLRLGRVPPPLHQQLQSEGGLLLFHESIPVTVVLKHFNAPGVYCGLRLMFFIGFLASSQTRLVASASFYHKVYLNLPYGDPRFGSIAFRAKGRTLSMSFNAEGLIPQATGDVTLRLRIPNAAEAARVLSTKGINVVSS